MEAESVIPSKQVGLPEGKPTQKSLLAEAAMLGTSFVEVSAASADLIADAEEMVLARADVKDLRARGYAVTDGMFDRVALLAGMLTPLGAMQKQRVLARRAVTAAGEEARSKLIAIRERLSRIGAAAGLPAALFSLETTNRTRLSVVTLSMEELLINLDQYRAHMPDAKVVDALIAEARVLIAANKDSRRGSKKLRGDRSLGSVTIGQLERLLLNAMQYLSRQGLAAYPDDRSRESAYRLDHVYARRSKKTAAPVVSPPVIEPVA